MKHVQIDAALAIPELATRIVALVGGRTSLKRGPAPNGMQIEALIAREDGGITRFRVVGFGAPYVAPCSLFALWLLQPYSWVVFSVWCLLAAVCLNTLLALPGIGLSRARPAALLVHQAPNPTHATTRLSGIGGMSCAA